jgi:hypothetical protein
MRYGPSRKINYHSAKLDSSFQQFAISFKGTVNAKKCMYINSISESLHHPSFKSMASAKKIWFSAVAHSAVRILNSNNSANLKQNSKNIL